MKALVTCLVKFYRTFAYGDPHSSVGFVLLWLVLLSIPLLVVWIVTTILDHFVR